MKARNSGYSVIEIMAVMLLISIASKVAINQIQGTMNLIDADIAANTVVNEFQSARQSAIDDRRNVDVGFAGTNEIKITRHESDGSTTVISDVTLPSGYTFSFPSGIGDTPDGYLPGSTAYVANGTSGLAVYVGAGTTGTFLGDGTFVDNSNVLLNGSIFTMGSGSQTARGITLAASSGRVKQYWLVAGKWSVR
jgi:type II secretory pathway pseudopilin PulG